MNLDLRSALDLFLAIYFSCVALFYTIRVLWLHRKTPGVRVIDHGRAFDRQWITHSTFRFFRVAIWGVCVFRIPFPEIDQWILVSTSDLTLYARPLGAGLLVMGFALALAGHKALGDAWRSGVLADHATSLIVKGLYARSRNPMFIGVKIALIGFLFALPSVFSLICLVVGWIMLDLQTRVEEKHLIASHGRIYNQYLAKVPRWL